MWRTISKISNKAKIVYTYIKCTPLHILTKDWLWCNCLHFFSEKKEHSKSFYIIGVYRYIMVKSLIDKYTTLAYSLSFKKLWGTHYQFMKTKSVL